MKTIEHMIRNVRAMGPMVIALTPFLALAQSQTLNNPASVPNFQGFIQAFLMAVVEISLPILTLFIVYSGFLFVTARGNSDQLKRAKENFLYVMVGAILILGAWVLATLIASTATQVLGTS
jgi:hypothetical protein